MASRLALTRRIADLYARGENMLLHLRDLDGGRDPAQSNSVEDIMISYDFQAGSYIQSYERDPAYLDRYTAELHAVLRQLGSYGTLLEAGCGEATTLSVLAPQLSGRPALAGFDIAWSRVKLGQNFALGREREAILELARVARKWLVLLEPAHDLAGAEARRRMESHGYVRHLAETIRGLDMTLVEHTLFPVSANPLNPTGLYLVRIGSPSDNATAFRFQCPVSGTPLEAGSDAYYSPESFLAYPILGGVPCLLESNAILATKFRSAKAGR